MQIILIHPEMMCIAKILAFSKEERIRQEKKDAERRASLEHADDHSEEERTK